MSRGLEKGNESSFFKS